MGQYFTADMHTHPSLKAYLFGRDIRRHRTCKPGLKVRATRASLPAMRRGNVGLVFSSLMVPEHEMFSQCLPLRILSRLFLEQGSRIVGADRLDELIRMMDLFESQLAAVSDVARLVRSVAELDEAVADGKIAFVHTVEGSHALGRPGEATLDRLDTLAERGVASITLGHFFDGAVVPPATGFPDLPELNRLPVCTFRHGDDPEGTLTEFGEAVVDRMLDLRMIPDLTHCPRPARLRALELAAGRGPVVATHSGAWVLNPSPMNLRDDEVLEIRRRGGVVGVILMNYWLGGPNHGAAIPHILKTIRHLARAGSETGDQVFDHIGLGSDFDGFSVAPPDITDSGGFPALADALLGAGMAERDVRGVMGENALRVLRQGWG